MSCRPTFYDWATNTTLVLELGFKFNFTKLVGLSKQNEHAMKRK